MRIVAGQFQVNCWVVVCPKTKKAVVIDPTDDSETVWKEIQKHDPKGEWDFQYLLHTHAHLDHFGGTRSLVERMSAAGKRPKILLHSLDEYLWDTLRSQAELFGFEMKAAPPLDGYLSDGQILEVGELRIEVIHTPGHSPGGVTFYLRENRELGVKPALFCGDTLFQGSIGRTDLWGGSLTKLLTSIRERIMVLDESTPVCPGHGPETTIGKEKKDNPFVSGKFEV